MPIKKRNGNGNGNGHGISASEYFAETKAILDRIELRHDELQEQYAKQQEQYAKQRAEHEAEHAAREAEITKQLAELAILRKENERKQAERDKQMGELSSKMGTLVEDFVIPDMVNMLRVVAPTLADDDITVNVRVKRRHPQTKQQVELDAIADGGNVVLVNETKTTMKIDYIDSFLGRLATFKEFFREYQEFRLFGMVSSLYVDNAMVSYAERRGLLVVALKPGLLQVMNGAGFVPKEF